MPVKDQLKILDRKIKQNRANCDLYRNTAEISTLSSSELDKYEYLTVKDLKYKSDPIQKAKSEYSPLGQVFSKGLDSTERQEGLLKRLKNIEDKTDNQLDLIKSQGDRKLERLKGVDRFYDGTNREIIKLEDRAIKETIDNMINTDKVFDVKISGKPFNIHKYSNLAYFGNLLFNGTMSLKEAKEQQEKISGIINELEKKIDPNKSARPLGKDNTDNLKDLIKNGNGILKTRADIKD